MDNDIAVLVTNAQSCYCNKKVCSEAVEKQGQTKATGSTILFTNPTVDKVYLSAMQVHKLLTFAIRG